MTSAANTARQAHDNSAVKVLGKAGMACYGAVYVIVAYLAVQVAVGGGGQQANQTGALQEIAGTPFGAVVLWVLAVGLLAFGLWQLLMAAFSYQWIEQGRKRVFKKIGAVVRGVVGISLGISAIRIASGSGGQNGDQKQKEFTARVMELPAGRILVGIIALVVIGAGVASIVSGVRKSFMKDLDTSELPSGTQRWVRKLGMIGYIAKGVGIGIVGILLGIAAIDAKPGEAGGLDSALRTLAAQPFGTFLLIAVALGFAAFGAYCFAAARAHRT
ncbi:DUF1206 domain-containing protein [Actinokineospora sp. NBRC 105648]|uniref:DUF1206 domain-containing protein n=1 Tax=Actinokineospora sp. NBRC 105648 TaxID=3032206 RepID=UPI0024A32CC8|nr:DUF1206 domain-containing protein [Actinokineospora sp. NBRC 105648]GLZ37510.1 hypothetical protein Acsp05_11350 [Actinokineospora sp. NBRC 105648]